MAYDSLYAQPEGVYDKAHFESWLATQKNIKKKHREPLIAFYDVPIRSLMDNLNRKPHGFLGFCHDIKQIVIYMKRYLDALEIYHVSDVKEDPADGLWTCKVSRQ